MLRNLQWKVNEKCRVEKLVNSRHVAENREFESDSQGQRLWRG
jgi:hypothetical protein